jgi:hypothetical protein
MRTYRVEVSGQFDQLTPHLREQLLAEQPAHDRTTSAFVPEGTFSYTPTLTRFFFRYLLDLEGPSAVEADAAAEFEGEVRATEYLEQRGIGSKQITVTSTCLQDLKSRSR